MNSINKEILLLNEKSNQKIGKERDSEEIIEKLKNFDIIMKNKDEKIEALEGKLKDANLKIFEQNKEIEIINKKLHVLKKKDTKMEWKTRLINQWNKLIK